MLASDKGSPRGLAVDGNGAYWTAYSQDRIMFVPLAGGSPVLMAEGGIGYSPYVKGPDRLALDATTIYWTNLGYSVAKMAR